MHGIVWGKKYIQFNVRNEKGYLETIQDFTNINKYVKHKQKEHLSSLIKNVWYPN
jgi:hypothetical protein